MVEQVWQAAAGFRSYASRRFGASSSRVRESHGRSKPALPTVISLLRCFRLFNFFAAQVDNTCAHGETAEALSWMHIALIRS